MEVPGGHDNKLGCFIYEVIGTTMLSYAVLISAGNFIGVVFTLMIALIIGGPISGGHYNPAVTTAVYLWKGEFGRNLKIFLLYLAAEFIGCLIAVGLYNLVLFPGSKSSYSEFPPSWIPKLCPEGFTAQGVFTGGCDYSETRARTAFLSQMISTFIFTWAIVCTKSHLTTPTQDGFLGCIIVALSLMSQIGDATSVGGAAFNPAVAAAQIIVGVSRL